MEESFAVEERLEVEGIVVLERHVLQQAVV
jgi:hypothetical protein